MNTTFGHLYRFGVIWFKKYFPPPPDADYQPEKKKQKKTKYE